MIGEFNIGGVFVPPYLIWGLAALALSQLLQTGLARAGAYRFIWHRGLFDLATLLLLWAAIAATANFFQMGE